MDKRPRKPNKLSASAKHQIVLRKMGGHSRKELAEAFGVSTQTISKVCMAFNKKHDGQYTDQLGLQPKDNRRSMVIKSIEEKELPKWAKNLLIEY